MKSLTTLIAVLILLSSCAAPPLAAVPTEPAIAPHSTATPQANLPNPASAFCEQQGYTLEIRTAEDSAPTDIGAQRGVCIFPDGSECEEWAYYRGECRPPIPTSEAPTSTAESAGLPTTIPTPRPIDPADYQGWWTYTHDVYGFSILLPEDWVVEEIETGDPLMNGHTLNLHPNYASGEENIRMTFRRVGDEARLWPTGVGQGEFIPLGALDVAGEPAQRVLLVCPGGKVTSIWYHQAEGLPNIARGELEFGFIFSLGSHCESEYSLSGKAQYLGEMIIASLKVP